MSRVKANLIHKSIRRLTWLVLAMFVLLGYSMQNVAGSAYYSTLIQTYATISSPPVHLEEGIAGSCTIYTNNTSAKVNVTAPLFDYVSYDYVLKVVNQVADNWTVNLKVYNSSNIDRLSSLNISLYDGTSSNQIAVSEGSIIKSEGEPYSLPGGLESTVYIRISNLQATTTDTSYLYVYLKIQEPNTSTYILFSIAFEIT